MTELEKRQQEVRNVFAGFSDPDDKWAFILKLAREHEGMDENLKADKFLVQGCAATMYLVPSFENGKVRFFMDTEGGVENPLISRGLGVLALKIYNNLTPTEILEANPEFFQDIGLTVALSATRANGFASLLKQIYLYARVYATLSQK
ncbi:MAG: SufE family protein [Fibrobacteraceae bacterium]|jgi:cysteine desulfuration protein SufE|nr:SufE family protein [Fibrobacteraceae bacterium]MEE1276859.1 SufE family protein [Fibrobacteraceae bacterium]